MLGSQLQHLPPHLSTRKRQEKHLLHLLFHLLGRRNAFKNVPLLGHLSKRLSAKAEASTRQALSASKRPPAVHLGVRPEPPTGRPPLYSRPSLPCLVTGGSSTSPCGSGELTLHVSLGLSVSSCATSRSVWPIIRAASGTVSRPGLPLLLGESLLQGTTRPAVRALLRCRGVLAVSSPSTQEVIASSQSKRPKKSSPSSRKALRIVSVCV